MFTSTNNMAVNGSGANSPAYITIGFRLYGQCLKTLLQKVKKCDPGEINWRTPLEEPSHRGGVPLPGWADMSDIKS